jgi:uncharacterized membrane protein
MANPTRINSIDFLRGVVMIIMALDHTRDFFHAPAFTDDPLNLQTTTPLLFFTRWITHFCAPVFVFLSGTSAYLQTLRKSKNELSRFLITRGLWLIFAELIIVTLAITYNINFSVLIFQVIGAIGISMFILGLLIWLPYSLLLVIGLAIVFGHNLWDAWEVNRQGNLPWWYYPLHKPTFVPIEDNFGLQLFYPFLPWTGIMICGYCFGKLYRPETQNRNRKIITIGASMVAFFLLLRWSNIYGDPQNWAPQKSFLYTVFSFVDTEKYPPSLLYSCMTLGPALIFLGFTEKIKGKLVEIATVFGRVPFFYYILHFYLIHGLSAIFFLLRGHSVSEGLTAVPQLPLKFVIPGEGYGLAVVYLVWISVVIFLYPLCKWYSEYKRRNKSWVLSYL